MTDPVPAKPKRSKAKTAAIVIGVVIAAFVALGVAAYVIAAMPALSAKMSADQQAARIPDQVFVSGQVSTQGGGTRPVSVVFIDDNTGDRISGGVSGNSYTVVLPNGNHNWRVTVNWEGALGSNGNCAASGLSYSDTMDNYRSINLRC